MKLRVVMLDTHRTQMALQHENESIPYGRRLVTIELTQEQSAMLERKSVGFNSNAEAFEEIGDVWLEDKKVNP